MYIQFFHTLSLAESTYLFFLVKRYNESKQETIRHRNNAGMATVGPCYNRINSIPNGRVRGILRDRRDR